MSPSRLIAVTILAAALTACNGDSTAEGEVAGEVLEGTISDEMLPVDQVRSEAPLADPTAARRGSADGAVDTAESDAPAEENAEAAEEPAADPADTEEE